MYLKWVWWIRKYIVSQHSQEMVTFYASPSSLRFLLLCVLCTIRKCRLLEEVIERMWPPVALCAGPTRSVAYHPSPVMREQL